MWLNIGLSWKMTYEYVLPPFYFHPQYRRENSLKQVYCFHCVPLTFPYFLMTLLSGWHLTRAKGMFSFTFARVADAFNFQMFQKVSSSAAFAAPQKVAWVTSGCKLQRIMSAEYHLRWNTRALPHDARVGTMMRPALHRCNVSCPLCATCF